jgi:exosortase E/protease (VPEID-CTERM system)
VRLVLTAVLVLAELVVLSLFVDTGDLRVTGGLAGFAADWGPTGLRCVLLGGILTMILAATASRIGWRPDNSANDALPVSRPALIAHLSALAVFSAASLTLFTPRTSTGAAGWLAIVCVATGLVTIACGALVFVPYGVWTTLLRPAPLTPVYGFSMASTVVLLTSLSRWVWKPWMQLTFSAVHTSLRLFRGDLLVDAATFSIGTRHFQVTIARSCSGFEGMALMLVFGSAWLWLFRREFQFPQALLLVPVGLSAMWILNVARITALILIGDSGATAVALGGFHSQAGWIAFLCTALAFCATCQRVSWIARSGRPLRSISSPPVEPTKAYLMPFLAILASGMLSTAATGTFEWGYGLRVLAAAVALWLYRASYSNLRWTVGWEAPALGCVVFVLWLAAERWLTPNTPSSQYATALAAVPFAVRFGWLLLRVVGAVVTVPLSEELAFRGYALRRLVSPDFTHVDLRNFTLIPCVLSSLFFGILHGQRWIVGTIAGLLFALILRRRGSIGDAVMAHATANALLAAWVLSTGSWNLW